MTRDSGARERFSAPGEWDKRDSGGVAGFEDSRATYRLPDGSEYIWESRRHRKGLGLRTHSGRAARLQDRASESGSRNPWLGGFAPYRISWWVAIIFIAGSVLFTLGAVASLSASLFGEVTAKLVADISYFVGAALFTGGVYLQLLEGINCSDYIGMKPVRKAPREFKLFAWQPRRLEFMAPFLLLIGAVAFNVETTFALLSTFGLVSLAVIVSVSSLVGAILFLVPSYMQMIEVCHRYICRQPRSFSWWVTVFFVVGSAGFVLGSITGFGIPGLSSPAESEITKWSFLEGSVCFLAGSYLLLPELYSE